jgi:hypothetical protein
MNCWNFHLWVRGRDVKCIIFMKFFKQCFSQKQLFHPRCSCDVKICALYSDWGPRLATKDYDDVTGTLKSSLRHSRGCPCNWTKRCEWPHQGHECIGNLTSSLWQKTPPLSRGNNLKKELCVAGVVVLTGNPVRAGNRQAASSTARTAACTFRISMRNATRGTKFVPLREVRG